MKTKELEEQIKVLIEAIPAENEAAIKQLALIQNTITEVSNEQEALCNKNSELANKYKEAILHGGFTKEPVEDATGTKVVDFDTMLKEFKKDR